jgi:Ca-activated chloride channel family protein
MRESARNGVIDAMVMEYQAYINEPLLKDYVFTPFGVRHDSPMYAVGPLADEKTQGLRQFIDFCRNPESQAEAKRNGFNANDNFAGEPLNLTGARLFNAQKIWKENKDAGRPVVAVFVADTSGSMEGGPITNLKASLVNSAKYIGPSNYIGLVTYSDFVTIDLPIDLFEGEHKAYFTGAIKDLYAAGGTATYDAVLVALKLLEDQLKQVPNAKLMLFVLSDGEQNEGYDLNKITPVVKALKIPVHTISYNMELTEMETLSKINEASHVAADENNVVYNLKNIFNAQM